MSKKHPFLFAEILPFYFTAYSKTINVKLELDKRGYGIAYEAHGKGLPIKVTGQLYRKGNTWRMIDIEDISLRLR